MRYDATEKIVMLRCSMRCFVFGMIGFLPGIGVPFALVALWQGGRARVLEKRYWNAARPHRLWGGVCATVSILFWAGILAIILINSVSSSYGFGGGPGGMGGDE